MTKDGGAISRDRLAELDAVPHGLIAAREQPGQPLPALPERLRPGPANNNRIAFPGERKGGPCVTTRFELGFCLQLCPCPATHADVLLDLKPPPAGRVL